MPRKKLTTETESTCYPTKRRTRKEVNAEIPPLHPLDAPGPDVLREDSSVVTGLREYRTTQFGKIFLNQILETTLLAFSFSGTSLVLREIMRSLKRVLSWKLQPTGEPVMEAKFA